MKTKASDARVLAPFIETVNDPVEFSRLFGDDNPATRGVEFRVLRAWRWHELEGEAAYDALMEIMNQDENSARLALYVPFDLMYSCWNSAQLGYMKAWQKLLSHQDARESFNMGDIYEPEASKGEPERVVKCLHLLPWLVDGYLMDAKDLFALLDGHKDDELFCSCVYDCLKVFEMWDCLSQEDFDELKMRYASFDYQRPHPKLLHETQRRKAWKNELNNAKHGKRLSLEKVSGPFSENITEDELLEMLKDKIENELASDEVIMVGGSRVKGYSSSDSDYDVYTAKLTELEEVDPNKVHFVFDTFWVSLDPEIETKRAAIARKYMELPADSPVRRDCLGRLEMDLLQFRLMHKGFPYAYGETLSEATRGFGEIDGASAFYDPNYRHVATELYIKYVYIPQF